MTLYKPPLSRSHAAYAPAPLPPNVHFETTLPSSYELSRMGYRIESENAVPLFRGEIIKSVKGEVRKQVVTVVTPTQTYEEEITVIDVGTSTPQVVYSSEVDQSNVDYDYALSDESTAYVEPTTVVESEAIVTYAAPPIEYAEEVYYAPPEYYAPQEYTSTAYVDDYAYEASGTASATQDLIGYGVLNQDGTTATPTYDPYSDPAYIAGLESQYG